jgi:hypothetical protein
VRFALLDEAKDASLDESEVQTDEAGFAEVQLTGPTSPALFRVRSSVGSEISDELGVSVSDAGYVTLRVHPVYSGIRPITGWVSSVHADKECSELAATPFVDGTLVAESDANELAELRAVPAGRPLAVTVRSARLVSGCLETGKLSPDSATTLDVPVQDHPIQLADLTLELVIGIDNDSMAWTDAMRLSIEPALESLRSSAESDLEALLDAVPEVLDPHLVDTFSEARQGDSWDAAAEGILGAEEADSVLTDTIRQWMGVAAEAMAGPESFRATLMAGSDAAPEGELVLTEVAGLEPRLAGFASTNSVSITADPADKLLFASTLYWLPSQLLTELAARLLAEQSPGMTPVAALAQRFDCPALSEVLAASDALSDVGCEQSCAELLCEEAVEVLWKRVRNASATVLHSALLKLTGTTSVTLNGDAEPDSVDGTWIGTVAIRDTTVSVRGHTHGTASR